MHSSFVLSEKPHLLGIDVSFSLPCLHIGRILKEKSADFLCGNLKFQIADDSQNKTLQVPGLSKITTLAIFNRLNRTLKLTVSILLR